MLVTAPADRSAPGLGSGVPPAAVQSWLAALAAGPDPAWTRLTATRFTVRGHGPVAWAAHQALGRAGLSVADDPRPDTGRPPTFVSVAGAGIVVWTGCGDRCGFATAPRADAGPSPIPTARALAARLDVGRITRAPTALHPLLGANAVHRLVCAVGGLPDPAAAPTGRHAANRWRGDAVFVARLDPFGGHYRPWAEERAATAGGADAVWDPELGELHRIGLGEPAPGPVATSCLRLGRTVVVGVASDAGQAEVVAARRAAQAVLDESGGPPAFAGTDRLDAQGRALRAPWIHLPGGPPVDAALWSAHPVAVPWVEVLTSRHGPVTITVTAPAPGVARAVVAAGHHRQVAVEARPAQAVAGAALAVTGLEQWQRIRARITALIDAPCGATPPRSAATADAESALQERLRHLPDGSILTCRPVPAARLGRFAASHDGVRVTA